ncbi:MAG: TonB-dependent receptor [Rubrivivax sp. SCN 71-131]|nr:MAG: TonB-dependent receptor [Rubrivivax sp. SCN 71-131]
MAPSTRSFVPIAPRLRRTPPALAALLLVWAALSPAAAADTAPQTVTITGRSSSNSASISGFGDVPLARAPFAATVISTNQLEDAGITGLADLTRLDAGTTDAYNAPGYWSLMAVRGFTLDPRANMRRDGLPINAETVIPLANKRALELLKGTSGLQAGTSAPGGLVNLSVKRPAGHLRQASLSWQQDESVIAAVDLGDGDTAFGWRVNAELGHLRPRLRDSRGNRRLLALAVDAEPVAGTLLEAEIEYSRQSQPSTPGLSLLGNHLPSARDIDPRINLNNQAWSLPMVMGGRTGSVRLTQALAGEWRLVAHAMRQRLDSDDRIAFPFGCSSEDDYTRYCSDGSFDLYDFRSEGERRTSDALELSLQGRARLAGIEHALRLGVLQSRQRASFGRQAYNWVGIGHIDGSALVPADPALTDENTDRDERSTELQLQDHAALTPDLGLWLGLRHTRLDRRSVRTDGSRATSYEQSFTTPWLAASYALGADTLAYASWGQGIESTVAPNRSRYTNAGQALAALRSRGVEIGLKQRRDALDWSLAAFDIRRPEWADIGSCSADGSCTRQADGDSRHRGIEAEAEWRTGAWSLRGSALWLHARREGSLQPGLNGMQPTNVPARSLKAQSAYNVAGVPGLALLAFVTREGRRMVLPDNSIATPGWTRVDLALRYAHALGQHKLVWRAGIDNLADTRAWKESPYQYGHAYLYPLAPRTWSLSLQASL